MIKRRFIAVFLIMLLLSVISVLINLGVGSADLSVREMADALFRGQGDQSTVNIIRNIRLPRILAALVLGGGLSLSGYLLQTFFDNPIVGPFVLGISSGAKLAVAFLMIFMLSRGRWAGSVAMVLAAFAGAMVTMILVLLVSVRVKSMSVLVVCGIMIGYICSAITDFAVTFADDSDIVNLHNWSMGSLSGMNITKVNIMSAIVIPCLVITFLLSKPIGAYRLGEAYARNMGVNITALRVALIILSGLFTSSVTAFAGPVSFVGIAVPHLVKRALGTSSPIVLIPGCFLGGSLVTLICDGIARTVFAPTEVSISSVTAVILVPVVIYMMLRRNADARSYKKEMDS